MPENPRPQPDDSFTQRLRSSTKTTAVGLYPHDLHPGLVPGISVDEQRQRFGVDRVVFFTTATIIIAFIAWGVKIGRAHV